MANDQSTFGSRLADARKAAGLTQDQLGETAGVSGAAVSAWEVNRTQPSSGQLKAVCDRLKVSSDYLLGRAKARV